MGAPNLFPHRSRSFEISHLLSVPKQQLPMVSYLCKEELEIIQILLLTPRQPCPGLRNSQLALPCPYPAACHNLPCCLYDGHETSAMQEELQADHDTAAR